MTIFVAFCWRGHGFRTRHQVPRYGAHHVAALRSMLHRHGDHHLACVSETSRVGDAADWWIPMPSEVHNLPGFYPKLWAWSTAFAKIIDERFILVDLDCVILADPVAFLPTDAEVALWNYAYAEPYNTSLVVMELGARPQVWDEFSVDAAAEAERDAIRWTGDQSWVANVLGDGERTFGEPEGVWCYRPNRDREAPPPGARIMFACGPYDFAQERDVSPWVREAWR